MSALIPMFLKNATPHFDQAIRAQWWGMMFLGTVIVLRELGKSISMIWR